MVVKIAVFVKEWVNVAFQHFYKHSLVCFYIINCSDIVFCRHYQVSGEAYGNINSESVILTAENKNLILNKFAEGGYVKYGIYYDFAI